MKEEEILILNLVIVQSPMRRAMPLWILEGYGSFDGKKKSRWIQNSFKWLAAVSSFSLFRLWLMLRLHSSIKKWKKCNKDHDDKIISNANLIAIFGYLYFSGSDPSESKFFKTLIFQKLQYFLRFLPTVWMPVLVVHRPTIEKWKNQPGWRKDQLSTHFFGPFCRAEHRKKSVLLSI